MTNGEKYKTAKERTRAFNCYCEGQDTDCKGCPLSNNKKVVCRFAWLELEAKEEKPMPCPCCNNEYVEVVKAAAGMRGVNCICGYHSPIKESEVEAIAAHNRICKAVAAYKENN